MTVNRTFGRLIASGLACAGLLLGAATESHAKAAWQSHAGGTSYDAARGGIVQTPDGGFISVGESQSFGNGDYDVYVVKVDICGFFQWGATYDIGGNDYGRRIRLDPNDGTYIITGETENARHCCTRNDAFLMKITEDGQVKWSKTYGGRGDDEGNDVQLYFRGEGYVMAGATTSFGAGGSDGWILAVDRDGNTIWSRVYGGGLNDGFNGLVQTSNWDIAATGYTNSYNIFRILTNDLWLVRTNSSGNVLFSYHYGGDRDEVGNAIIDAPSRDADLQDLVIAGYTTTISPKAEAYLLRVDANGNYITDHIYGAGNGEGGDAFRDLALAPDNSGEIFAVGRIFKPNTGFGDFDVFAVRVKGNLGLIWARNRGGEGADEAFGIAVDFQQGGFAFAGFTTSFTFGKEDKYLGLAFGDGLDYCQDVDPKIVEEVPGYLPQKAPTGEPLVWVECDAKTEPRYVDGYKIICTTCPQHLNNNGGGEDLTFRSPLRNPSYAVTRTYETASR